MPRAGVEPARPFGQRILSPQRLPFRHPGTRAKYHAIRGANKSADKSLPAGGLIWSATTCSRFGRCDLSQQVSTKGLLTRPRRRGSAGQSGDRSPHSKLGHDPLPTTIDTQDLDDRRGPCHRPSYSNTNITGLIKFCLLTQKYADANRVIT